MSASLFGRALQGFLGLSGDHVRLQGLSDKRSRVLT